MFSPAVFIINVKFILYSLLQMKAHASILKAPLFLDLTVNASLQFERPITEQFLEMIQETALEL